MAFNPFRVINSKSPGPAPTSVTFGVVLRFFIFFKFLIDFKNGNPNWEHFFKPDVQNFPGILWKQKNLNAMPFENRRQAVQRLEVLLF